MNRFNEGHIIILNPLKTRKSPHHYFSVEPLESIIHSGSSMEKKIVSTIDICVELQCEDVCLPVWMKSFNICLNIIWGIFFASLEDR